MRFKLACAAVAATVCPLAFAASASASTLGLSSTPPGSGPGTCDSSITFGQLTQDSSTPYFAPGDGTITGWQHVVGPGDTGGAPIEFLVYRSNGTGDFTVVGADTETLPATLPAVGSLVNFTLNSPIAVQAGDTLGLYAPSSSVDCFYGQSGLGFPAGDEIAAVPFSSYPPAVGDTSEGIDPAPFASAVDVGATFVPAPPPDEDAAVTATAGPSNASAGHVALLSSTVTNNGPGTQPITFTDSVPARLTIDAAGAGDGTCAAAGQTVTCTITGLASGQSAAVNVVVTPSSPGNYVNSVSVAPPSGVTDPNLQNNSATATLTVGTSLPPARCVVPSLKGVASGTARTLLKDLGCTVKLTRAHSKRVRKGLVLKTTPGKGSYSYQREVTLVVSSGSTKRHHKKK